MLSFLVVARQSTAARIIVAYAAGVLLALGPFDHGVISMLHVGFGLASTAEVTALHAAEVGLIALAGNLLGGVGPVTLSHTGQANAAERRSSDEDREPDR